LTGRPEREASAATSATGCAPEETCAAASATGAAAATFLVRGALTTGAEAEASTLGTGAVAGVADLEALTILAIIIYITTSFLNHLTNKLINYKSILLRLGYWS